MKAFAWRLAQLGSLTLIAWSCHALLRSLHGRAARPYLSSAEGTILVVTLVIVIHVIIAVHEIGHVIAARLAGFRFEILVVGPIRITRGERGMRLALNHDLHHYGGLAGASPRDERATRVQLAMIAAGGPAASLLFGGIIALLSLLDPAGWLPARTAFSVYLVTRVIGVLGAGSIAVGLANLVPMEFAGKRSDGARLYDLSRNRMGGEK